MQINPALIELHFMPCTAYMSVLAAHKEVYIEQQERYVKRSYRNRCLIGDSNGALRLSIPLRKGKNEQQDIRAVQIVYDSPWIPKFWHSIRSVYQKSPYFEHYADELYDILCSKPPMLFDLNWKLLVTFCDWIGLNVELKLTKTYQKVPEKGMVDWRYRIGPASVPEALQEAVQSQKYPQIFEEKTGFMANLSVLDLLFCTGPESLSYLEACAERMAADLQNNKHESTD
ncbi:MAG: WbqC family protein [Bacteroidota bacterium]